ncbi:MAG: shikimate kinase [Isosphaera sp.]|nr:shikimate kinase [Isosphaera sp.]
MPPDRIILVGTRGTGKTTVGRLLADRLGWHFADNDDRVEAAAGMSIADIFRTEGEPAFRDREAAALRELCTRDRLVLATGGGAVLRPDNRLLLRAAGFVAWLTASPETVWERVSRDPATAARRPNLTAAGGLAEARAVLAAREPLYRELAHHAADADGPSPDAVADAILKAWSGGRTSPSPSGASSSSPTG